MFLRVRVCVSVPADISHFHTYFHDHPPALIRGSSWPQAARPVAGQACEQYRPPLSLGRRGAADCRTALKRVACSFGKFVR